MTKANQARLAVDIAQRMSATPPPQLGLVLAKLEIEGLDIEEYDPWVLDEAIYRFVEILPIHDLAKLAEYYEIDRPMTTSGQSQRTTDNVAAQVFISYDSADKQEASEIAHEISRLGFRTFLAHRDIEPGSEWKSALNKQLDAAKAMVAVIGMRYHERPICSQEIGWAWARGITVVPCSISIEVNPGKLGLLADIQFVKHGSDLQTTAMQIFSILLNKNAHGELFVDHLIDRLASSPNFDSARLRWQTLALAEKLTAEQIAKISTILKQEHQVSEANNGRLKHAVQARIAEWAQLT